MLTRASTKPTIAAPMKRNGTIGRVTHPIAAPRSSTPKVANETRTVPSTVIGAATAGSGAEGSSNCVCSCSAVGVGIVGTPLPLKAGFVEKAGLAMACPYVGSSTQITGAGAFLAVRSPHPLAPAFVENAGDLGCVGGHRPTHPRRAGGDSCIFDIAGGARRGEVADAVRRSGVCDAVRRADAVRRSGARGARGCA